MTDAATPKAYVINEIWVTDPDAYANYVRQTPATLEPFGGRFIVRGGNGSAVVGEAPSARVVVIEFPGRAAAEAWYASEAYQDIYKIRAAASTSRVYIVDGVAP